MNRLLRNKKKPEEYSEWNELSFETQKPRVSRNQPFLYSPIERILRNNLTGISQKKHNNNQSHVLYSERTDHLRVQFKRS